MVVALWLAASRVGAQQDYGVRPGDQIETTFYTAGGEALSSVQGNRLVDREGNPLAPGDESADYRATEGSYNHAELHYRRADMERMERFDVARTIERFSVNPRLVVSNRFYRVCADSDLKMNWVPVRIDDL